MFRGNTPLNLAVCGLSAMTAVHFSDYIGGAVTEVEKGYNEGLKESRVWKRDYRLPSNYTAVDVFHEFGYFAGKAVRDYNFGRENGLEVVITGQEPPVLRYIELNGKKGCCDESKPVGP